MDLPHLRGPHKMGTLNRMCPITLAAHVKFTSTGTVPNDSSRSIVLCCFKKSGLGFRVRAFSGPGLRLQHRTATLSTLAMATVAWQRVIFRCFVFFWECACCLKPNKNCYYNPRTSLLRDTESTWI